MQNQIAVTANSFLRAGVRLEAVPILPVRLPTIQLHPQPLTTTVRIRSNQSTEQLGQELQSCVYVLSGCLRQLDNRTFEGILRLRLSACMGSEGPDASRPMVPLNTNFLTAGILYSLQPATFNELLAL